MNRMMNTNLSVKVNTDLKWEIAKKKKTYGRGVLVAKPQSGP